MAQRSIVNSHARFLSTPKHIENCCYRILEIDNRVFCNDDVFYLQSDTGRLIAAMGSELYFLPQQQEAISDGKCSIEKALL